MLKVAFASTDRHTVNQHFGSALGFAIYAIDAEGARLVEAIEFGDAPMVDQPGAVAHDPATCAQAPRHDEDKLSARIAALDGCAAVYCLAVGGSAVRRLLGEGIQPVRLDDETPIEDLLGELRKALREGGVGWLERHRRRPEAADPDRFEKMAEEGWQE